MKRVTMFLSFIVILAYSYTIVFAANESVFENKILGFSFKFPATIGNSINQKDLENIILYNNEKHGAMIFVSPYKFTKASQMKERMSSSGKQMTKTETYYLYKSVYKTSDSKPEIGEIYTFISKKGCVTITAIISGDKLDWKSSPAAKLVNDSMKRIVASFKFKQ